MFNPRYYFAMPIDDYLAVKETQERDIAEAIAEEEIAEATEEKKDLPGERTPFFEERG